MKCVEEINRISQNLVYTGFRFFFPFLFKYIKSLHTHTCVYRHVHTMYVYI